MRRPLIWMFYLLLLLATLTRILEFGLSIPNPDDILDSMAGAIFYLSSIAVFVSMCVELTLILTMNRLSLSLKLISGELGLHQMKQRETAGLYLTLLYACIFLGLLSYLTYKDG